MIASYYLESPIFKEMTSSNNFKNLSTESIIKLYSDKFRNNSPILDSCDFNLTLHYLTFWGISFLPQIVYDYLDLYPFDTYDKSLVSTELINKIELYAQLKFKNKKNIACGYTCAFVINENKKIIIFGNRDNNCIEDFYRVKLENEKFTKITCGQFHSFALKEDGTLVGWGNNRYGQIDFESINNTKIIDIACGLFHSIIIKGCEDNENSGELIAIPNYSSSNGKLNLPSGKFFQIASSPNFSIGIRDCNKEDEIKGELVIWSDYNNNLDKISAPKGNFISIACESFHFVAIRGDDNEGEEKESKKGEWKEGKKGELVSWMITRDKYEELKVPDGKFISIACGRDFSVGIRVIDDENKLEYELVAWSVSTDKINLINVPSGRFSQIACGNDFSIAIRSNENKETTEIINWGTSKYLEDGEYYELEIIK